MRRTLTALVVGLASVLSMIVGIAPAAQAIIGGTDSARLRGEAQVWIDDGEGDGYDNYCVGNLIDVKWVLTVEHCIADNEATAETTYVMLGNRQLGQGEKHQIAEIHAHPEWDAVLLELATPTAQSSWVVPYRLGAVPVGKSVSFRGWGPSSVEPGEPNRSETLRVATARVGSNTYTVPADPDDSDAPSPGPDNSLYYLDNIGTGISALGDSGAGLFYRGAIYGLITGGDENEFSDALRIESVSEWIQETSGVGPTSPLRVMPMGDSITTGVGSSDMSGYRDSLFADLGNDNGVDFVGTQQGGDGPDMDHEGHSGWRIDQISAFASCWVESLRPNVVTLHVGTNDLNQFYDTGNAPARLNGLIDMLQQKSPGVTVVVATLVPTSKPEIQAMITPFNAAVTKLVTERRNQGQRVITADMGAVTTGDLADKLHPGDTGYRKMADAFDKALDEVTIAGWLDGPYAAATDTPACKANSFSALGKVVSGSASIPTTRVEAADVNGDGYADYLAVAADGSVRAYLNNDKSGGSPRWTDYGQFASGVGVSGDKVRFADVNGDAYADYLAVADDGSVKAWINNDKSGGNPRWTEYGQWASATGVTSAGQVRFADINGDGYADYLAVSNDGSVKAWVNNDKTGGSPRWTDYGQWASATGVTSVDQVRITDINNDRYADYLTVSADGSTHAYVNNDKSGGSPRWTDKGQWASATGVTSASQVRFEDINGDGYADYLAVADDASVRAWINNDVNGGNPHWTDYGQWASGSAPVKGARTLFADLNGDGRSDYNLVGSDGSLYSWRNTKGSNGAISWVYRGKVADGFGATADQVRLADWNGDRRADYFAVADDGSTRAWTNAAGTDGDPVWSSLGKVASAVGAARSSTQFADINGDGWADYLLTDDQTGLVKAWINNDVNGGSPTWIDKGAIYSGRATVSYKSHLFADINNDLHADYLAVDNDGSVRVIQNNGADDDNGWIEQGTLIDGATDSAARVQFADLDADGRAEYLVVADDGSVNAWHNDRG
ncbi:FG-GAP-like repeat-containing protein [Streptomyces sp. NPDC087844]|uniref:FG-GAP-like repeat-containing protein n=1 Tax=Streptomyces sp. NPDC087844 TaxID=3365805 RepID=UPI0038218137